MFSVTSPPPPDRPTEAATDVRYSRQVRFAPLGADGQVALAGATAVIVGVGALGSVAAEILARAGVGRLRIVDRDVLDISNLQRQSLYTEADLATGLPKAALAATHLAAINSQIEIEPIVADVTAANVLTLTAGADVIVDGLDNFETRFLLNDVSIRTGTPWVMGGCLGAAGQVMTVLPGETACLRCVMPAAEAGAAGETCDAAGVLGPIVHVVAATQAAEAIKVLSGRRSAVRPGLTVFDLWENRFHRVDLTGVRERSACPCCREGRTDWLDGRRGSVTAALCGRNAVQLSFPDRAPPALAPLAERWRALGAVTRNRFLAKLDLGPHVLTVFADGRTLVQGTEDVAEARSLHARYVGA